MPVGFKYRPAMWERAGGASRTHNYLHKPTLLLLTFPFSITQQISHMTLEIACVNSADQIKFHCDVKH